MEKIVVSLTPAQVSWLRTEAVRLGISVSEVLRRILDRLAEERDRQ